METLPPATSVARPWDTILAHPPHEPFSTREALIYVYALYRQACVRTGFPDVHLPAIERAIHADAQGPLTRRLAAVAIP